MAGPQGNKPYSRKPTTIPGLIPSKRVSNVKPVTEYTSIRDLQDLRTKTLQHLTSTCPPDVRQKVETRIGDIDARIRQLTTVEHVTQEVDNLTLEPLVYNTNEAGPSRPRLHTNGSSSSSTNGFTSNDHSGALSSQSTSPIDSLAHSSNGAPGTSPTSPAFPISAKAHVFAQTPVSPQASKHRPNRVQHMPMEETMQREHAEYEKIAARKERQEARKAEKEALRPPDHATALRQGLTESEINQRILNFMSYKGSDSDEDDDEEEDEDDNFMEGEYGDVEGRDDDDDEMMEYENPEFEQYLSGLIKVDPSRTGVGRL